MVLKNSGNLCLPLHAKKNRREILIQQKSRAFLAQLRIEFNYLFLGNISKIKGSCGYQMVWIFII